MSKAAANSVPKSLFVFIVLILAAMYYYAAYVDSPGPEETVQEFYQAYFNHDYDTMAENLSVFWSVNLLPQYQALSAAQLVEKRDVIEKDASEVLSSMGTQNDIPAGIDLEFLSAYTKKGENSAITAYTIKQDGEPLGTELAILIKEGDRLRIFSTTPINTDNLEQIKDSDIEELDKTFQNLLSM